MLIRIYVLKYKCQDVRKREELKIVILFNRSRADKQNKGNDGHLPPKC